MAQGGKNLENVLIYNLGNRDLQQNGKTISGRQDQEWEQLLEEVKSGKVSPSDLSFPQFESVLAYLHRKLEREGPQRLDRIYVVNTDQNPDEQFRETDTKPLYHLLEQRFKVYQSNGLNQPQDKRVPKGFLGKTALKSLTISRGNPADYARIFDWYLHNLPLIDPETVWIYPTSGTPAMTLGLMMASVLKWGPRVRCLLQAPGRPVEENPWPARFLELLLLERLKDRVQNFDFAAAAALAPQGQLIHLATAALLRSRFDFRGADHELEKIISEKDNKAPSELVNNVRDLRRELQPLLNQLSTPDSWKPFLIELIFNARMCWIAGRDIDFLGRIYRLHEALLRYLLESLPLPTDDSPQTRDQNRRAFWGRLRQLGLENAVKGNAEVMWEGPLNRPAFMAVVEALHQRPPAQVQLRLINTLGPLVKRGGLLDSLSQKRNRTILGHGFDRVDHDEIRKVIIEQWGKEPEEWLMDLAKEIDPQATDPFEKLARLILDAIEQKRQ